MKKIFIGVLIFICMTCAGCFEGESHLIITDGGAVVMKNKLIGNLLVAEQIDSARKNFAASHPTADIFPIAENNMSGWEIRMNYPSLEAFAADGISLYAAHKNKCKGIRLKRNWFFDACNFDLISAGEEKFSPSEVSALQSMLSQVSFDLIIELPYAAESHNADKFDSAQKVLTWHLAASLIGGGEKHMRVQFRIWHWDKIFVTLAVELLLIAGGIFFHVKRNSDSDENILAAVIFRRNVFAGLSIALAIISAYMILAPVKFS